MKRNHEGPAGGLTSGRARKVSSAAFPGLGKRRAAGDGGAQHPPTISCAAECPPTGGVATGLPERFGECVVVLGHLHALHAPTPEPDTPGCGQVVAGAKEMVEASEDRVGGDQTGDRVRGEVGFVEEAGEPVGEGVGGAHHAGTP